MKQSLIISALIVLLFVFAGAALADNNCGGNSCQPLPTQAQACEGPAAAHNPHCQPQATATTPAPVITNTPDATEEVVVIEPTTEASATQTATETDGETTDTPRGTETSDGGQSNGANTETQTQGESQGQPAATEPVREFIPLTGDECDRTDVVISVGWEFGKGSRIYKDGVDVTPAEVEITGFISDIEVVNDCLVALVYNNVLYTMHMNGTNFQRITKDDSTGQPMAITGTEISASNNERIAYVRIDGEIAITDSVGYSDEGLGTFGRGVSISPDGNTIAYVRNNDIFIVSAYGSNVFHSSTGISAAFTSWSPNGQFLFAISENCNTNAFDFQTETLFAVGNDICEVELNPTGAHDALVANGDGTIFTGTVNSAFVNQDIYLAPVMFDFPFTTFGLEIRSYEQTERYDFEWVQPIDSATAVSQAFGD